MKIFSRNGDWHKHTCNRTYEKSRQLKIGRLSFRSPFSTRHFFIPRSGLEGGPAEADGARTAGRAAARDTNISQGNGGFTCKRR